MKNLLTEKTRLRGVLTLTENPLSQEGRVRRTRK